MRNKPKEPPKAPKAAPFFLPTIAGLQPQFEVTNADSTQKVSESRIKRPLLGALSDLAVQLTRAHHSSSYADVLRSMKEMGPSAIDREIRLLSSDDGGSDDVMVYFLEYIEATLKSNKDFELAHSYLALFLKVHGEEVASKHQISAALERVATTHLHSWDRIQLLLQKSLGLVNYLRSATV